MEMYIEPVFLVIKLYFEILAHWTILELQYITPPIYNTVPLI